MKAMINISIDEEVKNQIDDMANSLGLSRSCCCNMILRKYFKNTDEIIPEEIISLFERCNEINSTIRLFNSTQ